MNKLITIAGPTASGKTELALSLAKNLNGEIIGADSMQIYKEIEIGTAKPTKDETKDIPYHMIDFVEPNEFYTVSQFKDSALELISDIEQRDKLPIVCGGTGLYINSLLYEMDFTDGEFDFKYRESIKDKSLDELVEELKLKDPKTASSIDLQNRRRVERALEIFHITGYSKSEQTKNYMETPRPFDHRVFILNMDRQVLYDRINRRVDIMIEKGLVDEVKHLRSICNDDSLPVFQFIGFKEIISYLNGEISLEIAICEIKKNTRRFAKRQFTWFRKLSGIKHIHWIDVIDDKEKMTENIMEIINE